MNKQKDFKKNIEKEIQKWIEAHYLQLAIFNVFLLILVLLRSAGYFEPYLTLSINLITIISLVFIVILFNSKSSFMFSVAVIFWIGSAMLRILEIEVWAERTVIYSVQAILLGIILLVIENLRNNRRLKVRN